MEQIKQKIKPKFKIADDFLDLRTLDTNVIINQLEEKMKIREMPVDKQISMKLKKVKE